MNKREATIRYLCFMIGLCIGTLTMIYRQFYATPLNPDKGTVNCIGTTVAFDLTARGENVTAISFDPEIIDGPIIKAIYPDVDEHVIGTGFRRIRKWLYLRGGERGFLRYTRKDGPGHMVAYVKDHGRVYSVDAQKSMVKIPLWLFYALDKGEKYSFARLDSIDYADCETLWKVVRKGEK